MYSLWPIYTVWAWCEGILKVPYFARVTLPMLPCQVFTLKAGSSLNLPCARLVFINFQTCGRYNNAAVLVSFSELIVMFFGRYKEFFGKFIMQVCTTRGRDEKYRSKNRVFCLKILRLLYKHSVKSTTSDKSESSGMLNIVKYLNNKKC